MLDAGEERRPGQHQPVAYSSTSKKIRGLSLVLAWKSAYLIWRKRGPCVCQKPWGKVVGEGNVVKSGAVA